MLNSNYLDVHYFYSHERGIDENTNVRNDVPECFILSSGRDKQTWVEQFAIYHVGHVTVTFKILMVLFLYISGAELCLLHRKITCIHCCSINKNKIFKPHVFKFQFSSL